VLIRCLGGGGQVAKLCNNMLLAISMVGTAETMALGKA
jgi:3-hydroxyisobutyrate dehydrogenase